MCNHHQATFLSDLDLSAATANILTLRTPNFPNFIINS